MLHQHIAPALKATKKENDGEKCFQMRDNATCHTGADGKAAELEFIWQKHKCGVIQQPSGTPELNAEDHSFWTAHERDMEAHIKDWEKKHPTKEFSEQEGAFMQRSRTTALVMCKEVVDAFMAHTKTQCADLLAAKGWYFKG